MQFDIDVTHVEPGTSIEQSVCETIIGIKRESDAYQYNFLLMQLGDFIEKSLWKIGKQYTVRTTGGSVQILTHEEASKYNDSRFDLAIGKLRRCNRRLMAVDPGKLTPGARLDHGTAIIRQSRILALVKTATRKISLEAHKDNRPPIVIGKK